MGCDIHTKVQVLKDGKWVDADLDVFCYRNYRLFGWLAGVRNYSGIHPLSEPKGVPDGFYNEDYALYKDYDYHSASWFSSEELKEIDWDEVVEDRRYTVELSPNFFDGGATCEPGKGASMKLREFIGEEFYKDIMNIIDLGQARVVFWFDN